MAEGSFANDDDDGIVQEDIHNKLPVIVEEGIHNQLTMQQVYFLL